MIPRFARRYPMHQPRKRPNHPANRVMNYFDVQVISKAITEIVSDSKPKIEVEEARRGYHSPLTNHVNESIVAMHIPNTNFIACRSVSERAALHTAHFHAVIAVSMLTGAIVSEVAAYMLTVCNSVEDTSQI